MTKFSVDVGALPIERAKEYIWNKWIGENKMQSKWVLFSLTMWGVAVTTITAVLPAINGLLPLIHQGWTIEPSLVQSLNTSVVAIIQALGAVVGIVMIIVGRIRAGQTTAPVKLTLIP